MKTASRIPCLVIGMLGALVPWELSAQTTPAVPVITAQPVSQSVVVGTRVSFGVTATGATTYRWYKEARLVSAGTAAAYVIESARLEDAGGYRVEVANAAGVTTSALAVLTVTPSSTPPSAAPVITTQPAPLVVTAGASASFTVVATGSPTLRYQWYRNEREIEDARGASLTFNPVRVSDAGLYKVRVSNSAGSVESASVALTVNGVAGLITAGPQDQTVKAGSDVTFNVTTAGTGLTFQWRFNGRVIRDATSATLKLTNVGTMSDGTYSVQVANAAGTAGSASAKLNVTVDARLTNISTRGHVGDDDDVLIAGFVIRGQGSKKVLMRAVGPTLGTAFGVSGALANPQISLYGSGRGSPLIGSNSGWGGTAALASAFAQVGAFALPAASVDAALLATVPGGAYSAHVSAPRGTEGVVLAELYDADTGSPATEIVNISTRARVGAEARDTLIAGFTITGTTSDTILVRGVGPSLGTLFGMRRALGATRVAVYNSAGVELAANTIWGGRDRDEDDDFDDASDRSGAWRLPRGSSDSALLLTLAPGVYTAHVTGVNRSSGVALVEVFEVR